MILITGGTGFIGKALLRHLVDNGYPVRTLIRPSRQSPDLPRGVPMEVAVSSLSDERGLRAAMAGVDTIYHLVGAEWRGPRASLMDIDIQGTRDVCQAASEAGIQRLFFISHLGADRASAYPLLKAKAIAEETIRRSGLDYTIFRSGVVYGNHDHFTTGLAQLLHALPFFFLVPGDGQTLLQPLWVEDLATCLVWALEKEDTRNQVYSLGGPEFLTFNQILAAMQESLDLRRKLVYLHPPYLRWLTVFLDHLLPGLPSSVYWLDYLASNRTCSLDTIPRIFNLLPSRFAHRLDYLHGQNWRSSLLRTVMRRSRQ